MNLYSAPVDSSLGLRDWASIGVSDEASQVGLSLESWLKHYLKPRLDLLLPDIESLQEGETPVSIDPRTILAAKQFAYCLPRFGTLPEVSVDPDGEISFDWLGPADKVFSVSVDKHGRLAFAGWFGERSRVHGTEQLAEGCPQEILRGIARATF